MYGLSPFCTILLFLMLLFSSPPLASSSASNCSSQDIICNTTHYPCFCQSSLPSNKSSTIRLWPILYSPVHIISKRHSFL
ncbi:hypothetical protein CFP56_029983 [Quercus suber]|uniref:Secreted protein n=1 Tax=Quercus suber TaxID=58331 RepID=A0AAW0JPC0_QUESU